MEAISNKGTSIGIVTKDGIILAGEKKVVTKLLDSKQALEKVYKIDDDIVCVIAGISSDANILIDQARLICQRYRFSYQEAMPIEQLVQSICNTKQKYTQHGGMRPFGVSFLIGGWDKHYGYQLYQTDPSGNYSGWKATCIGANSEAAKSIFKSDYPSTDLATMEDGEGMLIKALEKTIENKILTGERLEIVVLKKNPTSNLTIQNLHAYDSVDLYVQGIKDRMEVL